MSLTAGQIDYGVDAQINVIIYQQFKWWSDEQKRVLEKKLFVSLANHLPHISWTKVVKWLISKDDHCLWLKQINI